MTTTNDTVCGVPFAACTVCGARWPATVLDNFGRCALCGLDNRTPLPDGYRRDRNGFPVGPCHRCGGSGRYSWNAVHADMCYGCQGSGWTYAVAKHHAAWRDAVRKAVRVVAQDLAPGDRVRPWGDRDAAAERTVRTVHVTDEACAWSHQPVEAVTGRWTEIEWDLADGGYETARLNGMTLFHRLGVTVDPAPYVAKAERGLRYKLSQRS